MALLIPLAVASPFGHGYEGYEDDYYEYGFRMPFGPMGPAMGPAVPAGAPFMMPMMGMWGMPFFPMYWFAPPFFGYNAEVNSEAFKEYSDCPMMAYWYWWNTAYGQNTEDTQTQ